MLNEKFVIVELPTFSTVNESAFPPTVDIDETSELSCLKTKLTALSTLMLTGAVMVWHIPPPNSQTLALIVDEPVVEPAAICTVIVQELPLLTALLRQLLVVMLLVVNDEFDSRLVDVGVKLAPLELLNVSVIVVLVFFAMVILLFEPVIVATGRAIA